MAAILCRGCSEICSGACDVCSAVCTAPCKLCGNACDACCSTFGELCTSPFSIYVTVATLFNAPAAYIGLLDADLTCKGSKWLILNTLFCVSNIVAAIYMAKTLSNKNDLATGGHSSQSGYQRISHLLCYDPWMAVYIAVLIGFFIWMWTGFVWTLNGDIDNGCSADIPVQRRVNTAMGFAGAFFFFGVGALCISLCCAYFRHGDGESSSYVGSTTPYVKAGDVESVQPAKQQKEKVPVAQAVLY